MSEFWNNILKVSRSNLSIIKLKNKSRDIHGISSVISSFKEIVWSVLREETLESFTGGFSNWEGDWGVFGHGDVTWVEEGSIDAHFEDVV